MNRRLFQVSALLVFVFMLITEITHSQLWQPDFDSAKQLAKNENKALILVFSGSDWCAPCMKLEREIWDTDFFQKYAKEHYVMYKADFPRKKKNKPGAEKEQQNNALAEKYNSKGYFPLVVIMDKNSNLLGETGYKKMTPEGYIEHLNSFIH